MCEQYFEYESKVFSVQSTAPGITGVHLIKDFRYWNIYMSYELLNRKKNILLFSGDERCVSSITWKAGHVRSQK